VLANLVAAGVLAVVSPAPAPVTIAVVDTGVAPLAAFGGRLAPGIDLLDGGTATGDPNGHGTAMAVVAAADPARGVAGVCPACRILPVVAIGPSGSGSAVTLARGVARAAAEGARVILVASTGDTDELELDAAIAAASAAGATVVVAAGNGASSDPSQHGFPAAAAPEAITVGALVGTTLAPSSNRGSWVDVAAPGVRSTLGANGVRLTARGTSAAAAYVAGVVGEMLGENPALQPSAVQAILLAAGTPVAGLDVRSGRVLDAAAALRAAARA
jgi:subtilase family protein